MLYSYLTSLLQPFPLLMLTLGIWIFWLRKRLPGNRRLWRFGMAAYCLLYLVSTPVFSHFLLSIVEQGYAPETLTPLPSDVIIVLTGNVQPADSKRLRDVLGASSLYRCLHAAQLYRLQRCPVIVSGGKVNPQEPGRPCSVVMREFLIELGLSPEDVTVEDKSRSTDESASACRALPLVSKADRIILVTEAFHMRRTAEAFKSAGLNVKPAPCAPRATELKMNLRKLLPSSRALDEVNLATHELIGRVWYWLKGSA